MRWERDRPDDIYLTQPRADGTVVHYTWRQVAQEARCVAAHLRSLALAPKSAIAILGRNSAHWIIADLAIWMAGHVSVPIYPGASAKTVAYVLEHSETKLLFVGRLDDGAGGWDAVHLALPANLPIVRLPLASNTEGDAWYDIIAATEPLKVIALPAPRALATIIYTSGSTGRPKGVMHSFDTMCNVPRGGSVLIDGGHGAGPSDRMLSYLPLAHCSERQAVEAASLCFGFRVFFNYSLATFAQDLRRARPTIFLSVPRLWIKFHRSLSQRVPSRVQRMALALPFVSGWFRRWLLAALGLDAVRTAYTGSGPLPVELLNWYRGLGLELLDGYGMTENFAYSHYNRPGRVIPGSVGECLPGVACRIAPDGEVLVKGPGSMLGYFKAPEDTADCFTYDGFLRTGDRGEIDYEGRLRITGRVKDLFKTAKGKYVAPMPIESKLGDHPRIEAVCVTGPGRRQPFALASLSSDTLALMAENANRAAVVAELEALLEEVNAQIEAHERLDKLVVVKEPWSVGCGDLTPTLKIRRAVIEERYLSDADNWLGAKGRIVFE
jgi:long-subunit acyl-CoA synthetase (AMP-forming)